MYAKTAEEIIATQGYKNLGSLNDFSWTIYKNVDNKEILIKAVKWMKEVVALEPVYMYIDTYAALLYKSRNLKEAKKQAKMAIDMGEKNDENTGETKELLKKINKALEKANSKIKHGSPKQYSLSESLIEDSESIRLSKDDFQSP
jgi:hypothetical protein